MSVLVGTSGWQYQDWRGLLYPPGLGQGRWLEHYAQHYATVENNSSFYRLLKPETFATWRDKTPAGFVMAVKASRYLTHVRRLRDPAQPADQSTPTSSSTSTTTPVAPRSATRPSSRRWSAGRGERPAGRGNPPSPPDAREVYRGPVAG
jgi:uncharacterized protein YecE (DUF72 family)